ncbi:30S ribosomal protein S12 methylthiotransferase RimO [Candidatus Aerophobetes bacterium]|nr:30S ribosomal protein S12 methylthiotransferase RimO [Candidatus Aerophobetes bacterium]
MIKNEIKINLISLGCPKNLVDSEVILGKLGEAGYSLTFSWKEADIIIINTCSFIKKAREESYRVISGITKRKSRYQKIIICGCLPQLEKRKLFQSFSGIDAVLGISDFKRIDKIVEKVIAGERIFRVSKPDFIYDSSYPRLLSTPPGYSFLKIAEGCSNRCSYCLIPLIRGEYRSREVEDVVKEAKALVKMGVKELILTSQDTGFYGKDKGGKFSLEVLLRELEKIKNLEWIRILYIHPLHFDLNLIKLIKNSQKICRYLDIPLQHTHDEILKMMGRPQFDNSLRIIDEIRKEIPDVTLRTTLMVGFPGEKEHHFHKLMKDLEKLKFDWVGVFAFSREENTPAFNLPDQLPESIKEKRKEELLKLQKKITLEKNLERVGREYPVMVDLNRKGEKLAQGHTPFQTPEIDGKTLFLKNYPEGSIFRGKITSVKDTYDLLACGV